MQKVKLSKTAKIKKRREQLRNAQKKFVDKKKTEQSRLQCNIDNYEMMQLKKIKENKELKSMGETIEYVLKEYLKSKRL